MESGFWRSLHARSHFPPALWWIRDVLVITGCFAECDCGARRVREQGLSSLIFPRQPKKKLWKQHQRRCLDIWRSQSWGQHCVVTFAFGEAKKWFTDPRKLCGAGTEATIEDELKAGASLICRLNSYGSLATFAKGSVPRTFRVLWRGFISLKPWKRR